MYKDRVSLERHDVPEKGNLLARRNTLKTPHGKIETPVFMPVGTVGALKAVLPRDLHDMKAQIILGNTYHLWLRPGIEVLKSQGGLRKWAAWNGPILTDSGGFQVFSLAKTRKITADGVEFRSHISGEKLFMSPEKSIEIQEAIASTIMMVLDVCPALPATTEQLKEAIDLSTAWAKRCLNYRSADAGALFGIVQGGLDVNLRLNHLEVLSKMQQETPDGLERFDGLALGGLSVGEPPPQMYELLKDVAHKMPQDRPRYLMGVGTPRDLLMAIGFGIDMFDCVMPTRNARNGHLFTSCGIVRMKNQKWKHDSSPLDENCSCYTCQNFSKSYLRHLYHAGEFNASILGSIHNLHYYQELMAQARTAIEAGEFEKFRQETFDAWELK